MTKEKMQEETNKKVAEIKVLCDKLEITLMAKQMVTQNGFIETVVYYIDAEKYPVDAPVPAEKAANEKGE